MSPRIVFLAFSISFVSRSHFCRDHNSQASRRRSHIDIGPDHLA